VPPGQNIRALWHPGALLVALWPPGSIHFGLVAPKARFVSALQYPGRVLVLALWHPRPLPVPGPRVTNAPSLCHVARSHRPFLRTLSAS
jgi:hypothetical protein